MNSRVVFLCFVTLSLLGCGRSLPTSSTPNPPVEAPRTFTFLLQSADDPRLPASGPAPRGGAGETSTPLVESGQSATSPVLFWNRLTTELGLEQRLPPTLFARAYALVHVGIYDALVVADHRGRGLVDRTVAAGVAAQVLPFLFPAQADRIRAAVAAEAEHGPRGRRQASWALGLAVGDIVVRHGRDDGSDLPYGGVIPSGDGIWSGTNPVTPNAGSWRCWFVDEGQQFQPEPPYPYGSARDLADVAEVLEVSLHRTPEQVALVHRWADRPPPVIWNGILEERLASRGWGDLRTARAYAFVNGTMFDAFVCCWKTKFTYWTARPFQRSPGLVTAIPTPNFPSYTSGHSTISAAVAEVIGELFPGSRADFRALAEEAAMSRLWAGIHFRHDNEQGAVVGRRIGRFVVRVMRDAGERSKVVATRE